MAVRSTDREIRLLDLLPSTGNDTIRCDLRVASLDEHPTYEALSYVWGDPGEEKDIEILERRVAVTSNLHAGLCRLRGPTELRTLWIDQLCINQWDLEEKAAQVSLMRDIYKQCSRCIIWMGDIEVGADESLGSNAEAVFDFLRQVARADTTPLEHMPILFHQTLHGTAVRKAFEKFSMYGNAWWSRIWTVQEAIIPTVGEFVWGPLSIPQHDVVHAARNLRDLQKLPSLPKGFASCRYKYTELLRRLLYPVHGFGHSETDGALDLLMRWRHREATDPRDKIYALLGLISPEACPNAQACDYNAAVAVLFAQITLDLIKHEKNLRPLLAACELLHTTTDTPTWTIDFASCNRIGKRQLKWWGHSHRYKVFKASKDTDLGLVQNPGRDTIGLVGVQVDEVLEVRELLQVHPYDSIQLPQLQPPLTQCLRMITRFRDNHPNSATYRDGFSWASAFCRTLVGDLVMDELPLDRLSSYGRATLQNLFEWLFSEIGLQSGAYFNLDFADGITPDEERRQLHKRERARKTRFSRGLISKEIHELNFGENVQSPDQIFGDYFEFNELYESLVGMTENQSFFITKLGYIGIGPPQTQPGDQIWVFHGGNVPFMMRKFANQEGDDSQLTLVGDAYVHGIMDGEALNNEPHVQTVRLH